MPAVLNMDVSYQLVTNRLWNPTNGRTLPIALRLLLTHKSTVHSGAATKLRKGLVGKFHIFHFIWCHPSPHSKWHHYWFSRFCRAHGYDQQTETHRPYYIYGNWQHIISGVFNWEHWAMSPHRWDSKLKKKYSRPSLLAACCIHHNRPLVISFRVYAESFAQIIDW